MKNLVKTKKQHTYIIAVATIIIGIVISYLFRNSDIVQMVLELFSPYSQ